MPSGIYIRKPLSDQHKNKIRLSLIGKPFTKERKKNLSLSLVGRSLSEEHKNNIRLSHLGKKLKPHSNEAKKKMSASHLGKYHSQASKNKVSLAQIGKLKSEQHKEKLRLAHIGKIFTKEHRENISKYHANMSGKNSPNYGKTFSEEHRNKISISARQRCMDNGQFINIGNHEKQLLDKQERIEGIVILRSCYLHQLGYVVDGYCLENNTVYEIYEKHHKRQVQKDLKRQREIQQHLNCGFIIIWDIYA